MAPLSTTLPELERIWLLLEHRRPELAEQLARRRLAADPADWPTHLALAAALRLLDRLTEAREAAQEAIRLAPEAAETHFALAQVRGQLGQLPESAVAADEALRLAPYQASYYGFRAQLFLIQRRYQEVVECAEAGLRTNPQQPDCLLWRALAQEALDQPAAADHDFARLLRIAPENELVHSRLGQLLLRRGEPRAAEPHLAEALRQAPEEAPQLVPLLRQARLQATWPDWLLRGVRREVSERGLGIEPGYKAVGLRLAIVFFTYRAEWITRHEPAFGRPPLVHPWASSPLAWTVFGASLAALIYLNATQHLRAGPTIFMLTIFGLRFILRRQKPAAGAPNF